MALDQDDIMRIQMVVKEEVKHVGNRLYSLDKEVSSMKQTLYGVDGENGLIRSVKANTVSIDSLTKFRTQIITIFSTVQIAVISYFKLFNKQ